MPKMSHSPPTKDSSPEQHLDDFGVALQSSPLAHSKSNDIHNRIMEKHEDNHIEHMNKFQEKRGGAMVIVNNQERSDIDEDHHEDISDQSAQTRDEIHEHQDRETDEAQNENDDGNNYLCVWGFISLWGENHLDVHVCFVLLVKYVFHIMLRTIYSFCPTFQRCHS